MSGSWVLNHYSPHDDVPARNYFTGVRYVQIIYAVICRLQSKALPIIYHVFVAHMFLNVHTVCKPMHYTMIPLFITVPQETSFQEEAKECAKANKK